MTDARCSRRNVGCLQALCWAESEARRKSFSNFLRKTKNKGMRGRTKLVSLRTRTRWRPWELSPSAPVASSRSPSENPPVLYHAVCGSIRTQRDFPLSGCAWHQRKAFSLDEQVQRKSSTISAAQRCIAGRVGRNFKRPARLLNLYRQCLAI